MGIMRANISPFVLLLLVAKAVYDPGISLKDDSDLLDLFSPNLQHPSPICFYGVP